MGDQRDGVPLTLLQRFSVGLHLAVCPSCKRYHQSLSAALDAVAQLKDAPLPDEKK